MDALMRKIFEICLESGYTLKIIPPGQGCSFWRAILMDGDDPKFGVVRRDCEYDGLLLDLIEEYAS